MFIATKQGSIEVKEARSKKGGGKSSGKPVNKHKFGLLLFPFRQPHFHHRIQEKGRIVTVYTSRKRDQDVHKIVLSQFDWFSYSFLSLDRLKQSHHFFVICNLGITVWLHFLFQSCSITLSKHHIALFD